jgi:hypothetical protein
MQNLLKSASTASPPGKVIFINAFQKKRMRRRLRKIRKKKNMFEQPLTDRNVAGFALPKKSNPPQKDRALGDLQQFEGNAAEHGPLKNTGAP